MKKNDCLQTPQWVWSALGPFDLDPCAGVGTAIANKNWKLEDGVDGLDIQWNGFVFCNPPFSKKEEWILKCKEHGNGLLLLPERGSAPWFGPLAEWCGCYFVMGKKINFVGGNSSNNVGSVLFPFGDRARKILIGGVLPGHFVEVKKFFGRHQFEMREVGGK